MISCQGSILCRPLHYSAFSIRTWKVNILLLKRNAIYIDIFMKKKKTQELFIKENAKKRSIIFSKRSSFVYTTGISRYFSVWEIIPYSMLVSIYPSSTM